MTEQCKHHGDIAGGLTRIFDKLDELSDAQAKLDRRLATIQAECKPCQALLARHEVDLRGANGDGLRTRVSLVEAKQKVIGDPAKRAKRAEQTSVGAILTGAFAVLWHVVSLVLGGGK